MKNEVWFPYTDLYRKVVRESLEGDVFVQVGNITDDSMFHMRKEIGRLKRDITINHVETTIEAEDVENGSLSFVMLEGAKNFNDALASIVVWYPKVGNGGIIAGTGWNYVSVNQACKLFFIERLEEPRPINIHLPMSTHTHWSVRK